MFLFKTYRQESSWVLFYLLLCSDVKVLECLISNLDRATFILSLNNSHACDFTDHVVSQVLYQACLDYIITYFILRSWGKVYLSWKEEFKTTFISLKWKWKLSKWACIHTWYLLHTSLSILLIFFPSCSFIRPENS